MNKPELIAFDLDDTLLRDDGTISERTLHDLHRLAKEGIITVIATGRMYATAKPYADLLCTSRHAVDLIFRSLDSENIR